MDNLNIQSNDNEKFRNFLEENLECMIKCPISQSITLNPVVASDGFVYDYRTFKNMSKFKCGSKSPMTREKLMPGTYKSLLSKKLIEYGEKYNLKITEIKFEDDYTYEDVFDEIIDIFTKYEYNNLKKFNNIKIDYKNTSGDTLIKIILCIKYKNRNLYNESVIYIIDNCENLNINMDGINILHIIFKYSKNPVIVQHVIDTLKSKYNINASDINVIDTNGYTPVDYLLEKGHIELFDIALNNGLVTDEAHILKYVNSIIRFSDDFDKTINVIKKLPNINVFDSQHLSSPLITAIKYKKKNIIEYLLDNGANIYERNAYNYNAIHYALMTGNTQIALYFLERCNDYEMEANDNWRLIHFACYHCTKEVIEYIIDKGVLLNIPISKFKENDSQYLPINLIELNNKVNETDMMILIDFMLQLLEIQSQ
jgi:ankyrin repeat protein